jgi:hypothetical protein
MRPWKMMTFVVTISLAGSCFAVSKSAASFNKFKKYLFNETFHSSSALSTAAKKAERIKAYGEAYKVDTNFVEDIVRDSGEYNAFTVLYKNGGKTNIINPSAPEADCLISVSPEIDKLSYFVNQVAVTRKWSPQSGRWFYPEVKEYDRIGTKVYAASRFEISKAKRKDKYGVFIDYKYDGNKDEVLSQNREIGWTTGNPNPEKTFEKPFTKTLKQQFIEVKKGKVVSAQMRGNSKTERELFIVVDPGDNKELIGYSHKVNLKNNRQGHQGEYADSNPVNDFDIEPTITKGSTVKIARREFGLDAPKASTRASSKAKDLID